MEKTYIYDAVRTPRGKGKKGGSLYGSRPIHLAKTVLEALVKRNDIDSSAIEDVILGCVSQVSEQGGCIAKSAALYAGFHESVPGVTLNRFCGSGLEAVNQAACRIGCGQHQLLVAGGVEGMSRVPMGSDGGPWMIDPDVATSTNFVPQGISADLIATLCGHSRVDVDQFALESQQKAANAAKENYFKKSIIPVLDCNGLTLLDHDETIRGDASMDKLSGLNPAFETLGTKYGFDSLAIQKYPKLEKINHVHHAGNSSGIVDGAAAVLLGTAEAGSELGMKARGSIKSMGLVSTDPTIMLTGPGPASKLALSRAGLAVSDIDLFEVNEAFASVVLNFIDELKVDRSKVNINGGAIAMGHPLGATGAILLATALDELERRDLTFGLITLSIGGGMGIATIIEREA